MTNDELRTAAQHFAEPERSAVLRVFGEHQMLIAENMRLGDVITTIWTKVAELTRKVADIEGERDRLRDQSDGQARLITELAETKRALEAERDRYYTALKTWEGPGS